MIDFTSLLETLKTGSGLWNPLVWITAIVIIFLIIYIIRGMGKKEYKEGTDQTQAFLSGNPEYEKEKMHIKGSNVYWGFMASMSSVYKALNRIHTGNVSDYVLWFVIIIGIFFFVLGVL